MIPGMEAKQANAFTWVQPNAEQLRQWRERNKPTFRWIPLTKKNSPAPSA
jgi:hypothetical protein